MPHTAPFRTILAMVALVALLAACGSGGTAGNSTQGDVDLDSADIVIEMETNNMAFHPAEVVAAPGDVVAIVLSNPDTLKHDFKIDDIGGESVHVEVQPRQEITFQITMPDEPGEWRFYCTIPGHEQLGMVGWIIVE